MKKKHKPTVSVVLSFYNEEDVLEELVRRLRNTLKVTCKTLIDKYELIFVNDDSKDRSLEILKTLARNNNDIKIINMSRNFGVAECVLAGFKYSSGDLIVYLDADLQDPPELIYDMLVKLEENPDAEIVYTTRKKRLKENAFKMFVTKMGYRVMNYLYDVNIPVDSGDFKLLTRRAVNEILKYDERKPFIRGIIASIGFKQVQIFYDRDPRFSGETKMYGLSRKVIFNALERALISFSDVPLKIALVIGFFISFFSFLYLIAVLIMKYLNWNLPGWTTIMAVILILGGIQLFTIGIIGLYLTSVFHETKNRPLYHINDTYGFDKKVIS